MMKYESDKQSKQILVDLIDYKKQNNISNDVDSVEVVERFLTDKDIAVTETHVIKEISKRNPKQELLVCLCAILIYILFYFWMCFFFNLKS